MTEKTRESCDCGCEHFYILMDIEFIYVHCIGCKKLLGKILRGE